MTSLDCLLMADSAADRQMLSNCLRISQRVGEIRVARHRGELSVELEMGAPHLVVLLVDGPELPPCLLRHRGMKVLAVTRQRRVGRLLEWLQQGASDIVSLHQPDAVPHAISRLVDECLLIERLSEVEQALEHTRTQLAEALAGRLPQQPDHQPTPAVSIQSRAANESLNTTRLPVQETDSASGLPARSTVLANWQRRIDKAEAGEPQLALLLQLMSSDPTSPPSGSARALRDLAVLRAIDRLHWIDGAGPAIVGRTGLSELLLVQAHNGQPVRDHVAALSRQLDDLDGLIDPDQDLRCCTFSYHADGQQAASLLQRLESAMASPRPGIARYRIDGPGLAAASTTQSLSVPLPVLRSAHPEADAFDAVH